MVIALISVYFGSPRHTIKTNYIKISIAQKMKFSIKDFFSNCDQIRSFIFCAVQTFDLEICLNWETNNYNVLIGQYLNKQKQSDNELI